MFLELVAAVRAGRRRACVITPRWARSSVATPMAPALSKNITPTCSGTAFMASRRSSRSWVPAARRFLARRPRGPNWSWACGTEGGWGRSAASARAVPTIGATVFGSKGIVPSGDYGGYEPLVVEIVKFFKTGKPPVSADETIEIFAFMEAADESKRQGGKPVTIESVMAKAKSQSAK